jgi:hypothetical protein
MPFLQEVSLEIFLVVLCINGMVFVGQTLEGIPLKTPFDTSLNVTATTQPNIYNNTNQANTLFGNVTNNVSNSTSGGGSGGPLKFISDSFFFVLAVGWTFIQFLTGGFIWQALASVHFPSVFLYVLQGVIGLLLVRTVLYYTTGR